MMENSRRKFLTFNTALCSFGMSGYVFHAPFINVHPGFNLYGVWERTKNEAAKQYPGVKTFRTLEEMLADPNIELVVVNTPSVTHYDFTKQVLQAGKHVVVEKPFTATVTQAEELIQLAKQQNVQLSVFQNRRWDSDFLAVKKILEAGSLGEIVEVEFHFDRFDPGLSYKAHKETPTAAVGSLYDLGAHLIDQALQLFGRPAAVFADLAIKRPESKVFDYFDVKLYYPSHTAILRSSYYVREALPAFVLHGTQGSFIKPRADVQEKQLIAKKIPGTAGYGIEPETGKGLLHVEKDGQIIREYIPSFTGNYMQYYEGIYQALRNDQPVPVSGAEGMEVIKIIEAAYQSNKEKKVVELK